MVPHPTDARGTGSLYQKRRAVWINIRHARCAVDTAPLAKCKPRSAKHGRLELEPTRATRGASRTRMERRGRDGPVCSIV